MNSQDQATSRPVTLTIETDQIAVVEGLPQLRDPARFEAWSYRLLVRACCAEGREERRWSHPAP